MGAEVDVLRKVLKFPFRVVRGLVRRVLGRGAAEAPPPVDAPPPASRDDDPWPAPASAAASKVEEDPFPAPASASLGATTSASTPVHVGERVEVEPVQAPAEEPAKVDDEPAEAASGETPTPAEERDGKKGKGKKAKKDKVKRAITVSGQSTPNPNAMKFTCSTKVVQKGSVSFENASVAKTNPLASALFGVAGVKSVFAVNDFVTVTKEATASWDDLRPRLETVIAETLAR